MAAPHMCVCGGGLAPPVPSPHMCVCGGGVPPAPVAQPSLPNKASGFSPLSLNLADYIPPGANIRYGYIVTVPPQALKAASKSQHSLKRSSTSLPQSTSITDVINDARKIIEKYVRVKDRISDADLPGDAADIIKKIDTTLRKYKQDSQHSLKIPSPSKDKAWGAKSMAVIPSGSEADKQSGVERLSKPLERPPVGVQTLIVEPEPDYKPALSTIPEESARIVEMGDEPVQQLEAQAVADQFQNNAAEAPVQPPNDEPDEDDNNSAFEPSGVPQFASTPIEQPANKSSKGEFISLAGEGGSGSQFGSEHASQGRDGGGAEFSRKVGSQVRDGGFNETNSIQNKDELSDELKRLYGASPKVVLEAYRYQGGLNGRRGAWSAYDINRIIVIPKKLEQNTI